MLKDDKKKERVAKFEEKNSGRYSWLLDIKDADMNPIGNGDICIILLYPVVICRRIERLILTSNCQLETRRFTGL